MLRRSIVFALGLFSVSIPPFVIIAHAAGSSLGEHYDVMEWMVKGLACFFAFQVWQKQGKHDEKLTDLAESLQRIEGYCEGKNCKDQEK